MSDSTQVYRRVMRRETHSPRSVSAVIAAIVLVLVLLAALVGGIWAAVDGAFRATALKASSQVFETLGNSWVVAIAVLLTVVALWLILLAILPGRKRRHATVAGRVALVIDDGVLADGAAYRAAHAAGVPRDQVSATVARNRVDVRVTPISGVSVNQGAVTRAAAEEMRILGSNMPVNLHVEDRGVIA